MALVWFDRVSDWKPIRPRKPLTSAASVADRALSALSGKPNRQHYQDSKDGEYYDSRVMSGMWVADLAVHRKAVEWLNQRHREFWGE
jgi:hypothetical protein